jgi:hypothetical protein
MTKEQAHQHRCGAIPIDPSKEQQCTEPFHWDDGVPYCDICGYYRASKHYLIEQIREG